MKAVVRKKFIDKYTGEKHEAGDMLDLEPERYEEIRKTDVDLVIAVADEPGAAGQSTADDAGTADGKADESGVTGQSTAEGAKTAKGKKEPKKKDQKSDE